MVCRPSTAVYGANTYMETYNALAYFAGRLAESWLGYIAADIGYDFLVLVDTPLIRSPISSQLIYRGFVSSRDPQYVTRHHKSIVRSGGVNIRTKQIN